MKCLDGQVFCGERCVNPQNDPQFCGATGDTTSCSDKGKDCPSGEVCTNGQCAASCLDGQVYCGKKCIDPKTDVTFCGATGTTTTCEDVGVTCPSGQKCTNGSCAASCLDGQVYCGGKCVDPNSDVTFCGATGTTTTCENAGVTCPSGQKCTNGECAASCLDGQIYCGGKCVDPNSDVTFCGATGTTTTCENAGVTCPSGEKCTNGKCAASCLDGQVYCGGNCVDLQTDNYNCGACGTQCPSGQACVNGTCSTSCASGTTNCGGKCLNFSDLHLASCTTCATNYCDTDNNKANGCESNAKGTDPKNCGSCGTSCKSGEACVDGVCQTSCPGSQIVCGGNCVDVKTDNYNCGACGTQCPSGQACDDGACKTSCPGSQVDCGGTCVTTSTDVNHCGTCDKYCLELAHATNGAVSCINSICKVWSCEDSYFPNTGNTACVECTDDNTSKCHTHVTNNTNAMTYSCNSNKCEINTCATGFVPKDDKLSCVQCTASDTSQCSTVNNGNVTCEANTCGFTCNNGYHKNDDTCEQDTNDNCGSHGNKCHGSTRCCDKGSGFSCQNDC